MNTKTKEALGGSVEPENTRDWVRHLAKYRDPILFRSLLELAATAGPFLALWALAWWSLSYSYWLTFAIALVNGIFVVRLFIIQHDCGHSSYFKNRTSGDWVGRRSPGDSRDPRGPTATRQTSTGPRS